MDYGLVHADGKPVCNMIDFVITVCQSYRTYVINARSYGGVTTRFDHHPVIADIGTSISRIHPTPSPPDLCFNRYNRPTAETSKKFSHSLTETLPSPPPPSAAIDITSIDKARKDFVQVMHDAAQGAFGKVTSKAKKLSTNPVVATLSKDQELLGLIHTEPDAELRTLLKKKRGQKLHEIWKILPKEGEHFWQDKTREVDASCPNLLLLQCYQQSTTTQAWRETSSCSSC